MESNIRAMRSIVIAIAAFLFLVQISACLRGVPAALRGQARFRALYAEASMVRSGTPASSDGARERSRQTPLIQAEEAAEFAVPRHEALLFVPLALLNYRLAYLAFFCVNLLLLALALATLRPYFEKLPLVWRWLPAVVFFCFLPAALALADGSDAILLLALLVASAAAFYQRRELRSGIFLGLALFNVPLVAPIALLFLLWRRWRVLIGFAAAAAVWAAGWVVASWKLGRSLHFAAPSALLRTVSPPSAVTQLPSLRCLFASLAGPRLSATFVLLAAVACSALIIAWAGTRPPNYALAILVTLLASQQGPINGAILLVLPLGLVLDGRILAVSKMHRGSRDIAALLFIGPALLFLAGWSYCVLALLLLALLVTLRSTSTGYLRD